MKIILPLVALALLALPAHAATVLTVKVNGLVCDFCARSIEKVLLKQDSVSTVHVDLDNGKIHVGLKEGQALDDAALTKMITDAGYTVTSIERGE